MEGHRLTHKFSSRRRLRLAGEFDHVFKKNQHRLSCAEFLVLSTGNNSTTSRIGLVIGKKTSPLAVNRNKIKRLVRESFRTTFNHFLGVDIVVVSRPPANKFENGKLMEILKSIWLKLETKIVASDKNG